MGLGFTFTKFLSMPEKGIFPLRFLFCLISFSMFLLLLSSLFLFQIGEKSFLSRSEFKLIIFNSTSYYFKPKDTQKLIGDDGGFHISSSGKRMGSIAQKTSRHHDPNKGQLRVFMYDLPPEFHFGLLGWTRKGNQTWPDVSDPNKIPSYPGGLNLQHSMEYWLTLDLLSSNIPNMERSCSAIKVQNSREADIIFVPFFASLSYNRHSKRVGMEKVSVNKVLQDRLVKFLLARDEWRRSGGRDHLIVAHHPNSLLDARRKLGSAMFVLADFGRYPVEIANLQKDVIAPYRHLVNTIPKDESAPFDKRPILVYFQGAIYRKDGGAIRQELYYLLMDEKDVHFKFGSIQGGGIKNAGKGMASSKFCLNIAGDTPSSNRLFDAIASHCVPVIISDEIELPFEDVLNYSEFCIFVRISDALKNGFLLNLLRGIKNDDWTKMWERLKDITRHFEYQYPSPPSGAVDMIWRTVSRKISGVHSRKNRRNRYRNFTCS